MKVESEIVLIGGPTGTGKSEVACCVAERIGGEIVSADAMSVYRGMDVGTAKPRSCMKRIRHHLVDIVDPGEVFDAKRFEELALKAIESIRERGRVPLVVGGSYLYIQALLYGIEETPPPNWKLRSRLYLTAQRRGKDHLYRILKRVDPHYAEKVHPNDLRRIVRALEVFVESGKPFSRFHRWSKPRFSFTGFYLRRSWEKLTLRIEERVHRMIAEGLLEEVKELMQRGFEGFLTSPQAIGYKELVPYVKGEISLKEAVDEIVRRTKEYARRQIRWFRRQGWIEVDLDRMSLREACDFICSRVQRGTSTR